MNTQATQNRPFPGVTTRLALLGAATLVTLAACGSDIATNNDETTGSSQASRFVLGSISIDADGNRVSYAQLVKRLKGHFTNADGLEAPGNAVFLSHGSKFFYGLAESPEWVRYSTKKGFKETGRLSFLQFGVSSMDFANTIVDAETAVSVLTEQLLAVVWNPATMEIKGTVDLGHLQKEGYSLEAFTTVSHAGLVYIPGKWVNWETADVLQRVSITVLDPEKLKVVGVAEDDRCGAGGRVTFDEAGYAYVMGDGRNQSMQVFAAARGEPTVKNCLLRIPPGKQDFEKGYFHTIPSLTGGPDSMTEMEAANVAGGVAFSMMFYPDRLPAGLDLVNFEHWGQPAFKLWRITLGDTPTAEVVDGANFSVVGFPGSAVNDKLYSSESADGIESTVYEIDPVRNTSTKKFSMAGYYAGLYPLTE